MNRPLDEALRDLPRREGRSDWNDLESRLAALRPARPARRRLLRRRPMFAAGLAALLALGATVVWRHSAAPAPEASPWVEAHETASIEVAWADPWVAAAVETSR